jgi:hypothetical protein
MIEKARDKDVGQAIEYGYHIAMYKPIAQPKLAALKKLYDKALSDFSKDPLNTCEITGGEDKHNNPETAALVVVANALLNLDELITKN